MGRYRVHFFFWPGPSVGFAGVFPSFIRESLPFFTATFLFSFSLRCGESETARHSPRVNDAGGFNRVWIVMEHWIQTLQHATATLQLKKSGRAGRACSDTSGQEPTDAIC